MHSCAQELLEKVVKVTIKQNEQGINVTIKVIENVDSKYLDTKVYIEDNLKEKT